MLLAGRVPASFSPAAATLPCTVPELSGEGQRFLADILSRRNARYLLERGASVGGSLVLGGKRVDGASALTNPVRPEFSRAIVGFIALFASDSACWDDGWRFTPCDELIVLSLCEDVPGNAACAEALRRLYLPALFFPDRVARPGAGRPADLAALSRDRDAFLSDEKGFALLFALRYAFRDAIARSLASVLALGSWRDVARFGECAGAILDPLFRKDRTEWIEPMCGLAELSFSSRSHAADLERMISNDRRLALESERAEARSVMLGAYGWVSLLLGMQREATRARPFDDGFEEANVFKKYWATVGVTARENARTTVDWLENRI